MKEACIGHPTALKRHSYGNFFYYQYTKQSTVMQMVGSFDHVNERWTVSVSLCIVNSKGLSLNITQIQQTI